MVLEQLKSDLIQAQKAKDEITVSTLRYILSQVNYAKIAKQAELSDDDVIKELARDIKRHEESIAAFTAGGRLELAEKEAQEVAILRRYMPEQMSHSELEAIVAEAIVQMQAQTIKDMGKVMNIVMAQVGGKADGSAVSTLVKQKLQEKGKG